MKKHKMVARALGLVLAKSSALSAQDYTQRYNDAVVGMYFRLPLGGVESVATANKAEYGFRLQFNDSYTDFTGRRDNKLGFSQDALTLKFNAQGFDNFAISGRNIIEPGTITFNADGTAEKSGGGINWALVGVGVAAVVVVGAVAVGDSIEDTFEVD
ncbi:MAG: hypothetical protein JJ850_16360 [Kordiimonadaceae bacterium]|nr:hypothetical protein [Kordiimonadaceae bacterium]MBO6569662.1 hypothetical protein [Kordiimonadaceae bacterium]MBO6966197.1 hypothetical protein [Kordiimonadaceae bacterium]